jgi:hypothetical protein
VDEFWAWFPTVDDIVALGAPSSTALELRQRYADWDFQLLTNLVSPSRVAWPQRCHDVHALARSAGVSLPINKRPHHPLHDAAWNREVFISATVSDTGDRQRADQ